MTPADLLPAVAAHGLPGALTRWPEQPLPPEDWQALLTGVRRQLLSGLLVAAVRSDRLPHTARQAAAASALHLEQSCQVLRLESEALLVLEALEEEGLAARLLKGSAVAHLDYPDPGQRVFVDVDLLVTSSQIGAAVAVLTELGHRRHRIEPRAGFDRRFGKGATFSTPSGHELDLHRTFVMGPYGLRLQLEDLWQSERTFELGGRTVAALDDECRFLHACFHAALGDRPPRLVPQRDLAQMLLAGRLDVGRVRRLMRAWQAEPVVARAVNLTWQTLRLADVTELSAWAGRYVPSPRDRKDLAVYVDPTSSSYAAKSVAALTALPSAREKLAFAAALALPRRGFVPEDEAHRLLPPWRRAAGSALERLRRSTQAGPV